MGKRKQKEEQVEETKGKKSKKEDKEEEEDEPVATPSKKKGKGASESADGTDILSVLKFDIPADKDSFEKKFDAIADKLLNEYVMMIKGKPHRFMEVEFYWNGEPHNDAFTHGDPDQKKFGTWYFHKSGSGYKGGTYKGLDIAFGNDKAFGGILIRSIEAEGAKKPIEGPCVCVDTILKENGGLQIAEFVKTFDSKVHNPANTSPLHIVHKVGEKRPVYKSGRVGLTLKKADNKEARKEFILKPYRYFTNPPKLKKGKNYIICALHAEGKSPAEIKQITGSPADTIERFTAEFDKGKSSSVDKFFGTDVSKPEDLCRLYGAYHAFISSKSK